MPAGGWNWAELRSSGALAPVAGRTVQRATRLPSRADLAAGILSPAGVVRPQACQRQPVKQAMLTVPSQTLKVPLANSSSYEALASSLAGKSGALAAFFDGDSSVMVMADDPAIRRQSSQTCWPLLRNQPWCSPIFRQLASKSRQLEAGLLGQWLTACSPGPVSRNLFGHVHG